MSKTSGRKGAGTNRAKEISSASSIGSFDLGFGLSVYQRDKNGNLQAITAGEGLHGADDGLLKITTWPTPQ